MLKVCNISDHRTSLAKAWFICVSGGCEYCPENSSCTHGFCVCNFGFYEEDGQCVRGRLSPVIREYSILYYFYRMGLEARVSEGGKERLQLTSVFCCSLVCQRQ